VLSHSGSRGPGGQVAQHYSEVARGLHPELPPQLQYLSWLSLDSEPGREYWRAMELMGRFAQANHALIHDKLRRALKAKVLARVENHHNFAWRERHDGRDLVVHRKGAIPAGEGRLGIIPGSMADPGYVVRGRGCDAALRSASHGAGRRFSRKEAKSRLVWGEVKKLLKQRGVTLVSGSLDETPEAYKNIQDVMGAQTELVDVVGRFRPRIVKMSD